MITASHNENGWTGLKLAKGLSSTLEPDDILAFRKVVDGGGWGGVNWAMSSSRNVVGTLRVPTETFLPTLIPIERYSAFFVFSEGKKPHMRTTR